MPALRDDADPQHDGWLRLVDPETGVEEVLEIDAALRAAMREELALLARQQDAVFAAAGASLHRFAVPARDDFRLQSWFQPARMTRL